MDSTANEKSFFDKFKAGFEEFKEGFLANANMVKQSLEVTFGNPQARELPNPGSVDLDLDYPRREHGRTGSSTASKSNAGPSSPHAAMTGEKST